MKILLPIWKRNEEGMAAKSKLLEMLEQNRGIYLSGERLAEQLGVSRAAVWKAIKQLREEGYEIQAVTNKGYALAEQNDILSAEAVRCFLENQEVQVQVFQEISSTSQVLKQMALENKLPHGSVVVANCQKQGKGRRGRQFYSPGNSGLYLSVLLYPQKTAGESLKITAAAAVAVCRAVEQCCGKILGIKWVNDLYLDEKKVCGILTEAVTDFETGDIEFAVAGIGLNLYEPEGGFPKELEGKAGNMLRGDEYVDRNRLAGCIVNELLKELDKNEIPKEYIERNIVPGRWIFVRQGETSRRVKAERILEDGRLLVIREDGEKELLQSADVSLEL